MTDEIVQIVDRENQPTEEKPRSEMRHANLIHRATYILVFNANEELFIQKRTATKDIYPGYWDIAAGGVVLAGESYEYSAKRELEEELGLNGVDLEYQFELYYQDDTNRVWGKIFTCTAEGPFVLQQEEIEYGKFCSLDAIAELQEPVTPDGLKIIELMGKRKKEPVYFLHGLESSGRGTKGQFFAREFPEVFTPDFSGTLEERNYQFEQMVDQRDNLTLIGSSFGGLMATCFAINNPKRTRKLVLLAPALNFEDFKPPEEKITTPTILIIGKDDDVCPPDLVIPLAEKTFANLSIQLVDDDHMLHLTYKEIDWNRLLYSGS